MAAVADPGLGDILAWAPNFEPRGWMFCDGRLLPIVQYQALYALLGTLYGGDGVTYFALPDLRGRIPIGAGNDPRTGRTFQLGETGGAESAPLAQVQVPLAGSPPGQPGLVAPTSLPTVPPSLGVNYIIAVVGVFPSRD